MEELNKHWNENNRWYHKMSTVSSDSSRKTATHRLLAATTIKWSSFLHSTNSHCFSSARCH